MACSPSKVFASKALANLGKFTSSGSEASNRRVKACARLRTLLSTPASSAHWRMTYVAFNNDFLQDFLRGFRVADAVDIGIVAVFLYSVLVWFLETAYRRMAEGVMAVLVLYFLAVKFNLYLTSQVLHAGLTILLIMLVVIFQDDLRAQFERLASLGTLRQLRPTVLPASELDTLVQAAFSLAEKRRWAR